MKQRSLRWRALAIPMIAGAAILTITAGQVLADPPDDGHSRREGHGWRLYFDDGSTEFTHGPDEPLAPVTSFTAGTGTSANISCTPTNQPHWEVIHAYPKDLPPSPERAATVTSQLKQAVYDMSAFVDSEAQAASANARALFPVECGSDETLVIHSEALRTISTQETFWSILNDLKRAKYRSRSAKYLIFYDDCREITPGQCFSGGQGTLDNDSSPSASNRNNVGPDYAVDYTNGAGGGPSWSTLLHEAGHNMGAVQNDAPNTTGAHHCIDGLDIMCYNDGGPRGSEYNTTTCPGLLSVGHRWDCGLNDYFSPVAAPGNYLFDHWNLASTANAFLKHSSLSARKH